MLERIIFSAFALCVAAPAAAVTVDIDFEGGTEGQDVGTFYAGQGVVFSGAEFDASPGQPGADGLMAITGNAGSFGLPKQNTPITIDFDFAVDSVSVVALDVGTNDARIDAFDIDDNLIDFDVFVSTNTVNDDFSFSTLTVTGAGIRSIELYQPSNDSGTDGINFDTLSFTFVEATPVPAPGALGLLGLGALALGFRRRTACTR